MTKSRLIHIAAFLPALLCLLASCAAQPVPGPTQPAAINAPAPLPALDGVKTPFYDLVLEGKFIEPGLMAPPVLNYMFQPRQGQALRVWLNPGTVLPEGYWPNYDDEVRLYLNSIRQGGPLRGPISRLEVLLAGQAHKTSLKPKANQELARRLIFVHDNFGRQGYELVVECLDQLSQDELRDLKHIIHEDIQARAHLVVGELPMDYRYALRVIRLIDDRLHALEYNLVLEGRFLQGTDSTTVMYYDFLTEDGNVINVYVATATLRPYYDYKVNYQDRVRLYIIKTVFPDGDEQHGIVKINLLK